jgi:hypothetical protein
MNWFLILTRTLTLIPAIGLIIFAAFALSACQVGMPDPDKLPKPPSPAMVCGPLRGLVAEVIGSSAADMRKACAIAEALNGE